MDAAKGQSGGDAGSKGVGFQIGLLMLFLLNALRRLKDWRLSTEKIVAGKFDDVVLESPEGAVLLQAKHKKSKKITMEELLPSNSKNDDFSLPKYFLSYQEIKSEFKGDNALVICSNADVHEQAMEFLERRRISLESVLYHANDAYCFYKLDAKILPRLKQGVEDCLKKNKRNKNGDRAVVTDEDLNDFVDRLQIFASFPADKDLENIIEQLLSSMKRSNTFYETTFALELRSKLMDWFQHKDGVYMTEANAMAIFSELRTEKYSQSLDRYGVEFRHDHLLLPDSKRVHHVVVETGHLLEAIKIHRALRKRKAKILSINPEDTVETQRQIVDTFRLKKFAFMVIVWPKRTEKALVTEIADKLSAIVKAQQNKKVVLVAEPIVNLNRLFGLSPTEIDVSSGSAAFDELTDETQEILLNKKNVVFQGRDVSLKELFPKRDCLERAADLLLQKLIEDEKVTVGAPLLDLDESVTHLYINRTFNRQIERMHISCSENDIYDVQEKIVLISDTAGMGKTTVLTNLAASLKRKYPLLWVIQLRLNEFSVTFKALSKAKQPITILNLLNSKETTRLANELDKLVFAMDEKVCLILNGVNELCPDYTDLVLSLLLQCQETSNIAKVFVATRPHVLPDLQKKLRVASFTLEPFTEENQIRFLTDYWTSSLNLREDTRTRKYATAFVRNMSLTDQDNGMENFASIPLQLRMLAEIFQESMLSTDWEGCKEFVYADEEEPRLPERMNLVELYGMFIDKKREIFVDAENPSGHTAVTQALRSQFGDCLHFHRNVALNIALAEENRRLFSCYGKGKDMEAIALKIGILQKANNGLHFIHRTLAEYYVAESVIEELKLGKHGAAFQKFLIEEVFYAAKYSIVLSFLENFLQSNLDSIPTNAFQAYKSLTSCHRGSTWKYNNNLIHQLAERGCVSVLSFLLRCAKFTVTRDKTGNLYDFDFNYAKINRNSLTCAKYLLKNFGLNVEDDFGRTPLHLAASKGHVKMVKFLAEHGATTNGNSWGYTPLVEAARNGRTEATKYLLTRGLGIETAGVVEAVRIGGTDMETFLLEIILGSDGVRVDMKIPYVAASMGCLNALIACMERGVDVNGRFENGETLIIAAACGRYRYIIEYLVQNGADINGVNKIGRSALHLISQDPGSVPTAELLIRLGIDIHATDNVGKTAFHLAASSNHFEMMKLLISNGADVNVKDKIGNAALHEAAAYGNSTCVEFLATNGADVNTIDGKGNAALHLCVGQWRASKIASTLVDNGATLYIQNYRGQTAFHVAVSLEDETMVRFLARLDREVDTIYEELEPLSSNVLVESDGIINNKDKEGRTVLHLAAERGCASLVGILIEAGADVSVGDDDGRTPLHVAADRGRQEVALLLIERGADVKSRDNAGLTPAVLAERAGHLHLLQYLKRKEVKPAGVGFLTAVQRLFKP